MERLSELLGSLDKGRLAALELGRTQCMHGRAGPHRLLECGRERAQHVVDGTTRATAETRHDHGLCTFHWTTGMAARQPVMEPSGVAVSSEMRVSSPPCWR